MRTMSWSRYRCLSWSFLRKSLRRRRRKTAWSLADIALARAPIKNPGNPQ
jgi:hypothetical protein